VFTRARMDLSKQLMLETSISLNESKRREQQTELDNKQLVLENNRRVGKGETALTELKKQDEDELPSKDDKLKPEDDAYLTETGRILIDYLGLSSSVAAH
jgi:carboxyl-terminal processing protease